LATGGINHPKEKAMDEKSICVCGVNFRLGVSTLEVDALRADGSLIDTARYESRTLSFVELYAKYGRRAVRYFRKAYGIQKVTRPSSVKY
jgi:hypothetical protein